MSIMGVKSELLNWNEIWYTGQKRFKGDGIEVSTHLTLSGKSSSIASIAYWNPDRI